MSVLYLLVMLAGMQKYAIGGCECSVGWRNLLWHLQKTISQEHRCVISVTNKILLVNICMHQICSIYMHTNLSWLSCVLALFRHTVLLSPVFCAFITGCGRHIYGNVGHFCPHVQDYLA
jgi:hypothetical protein